MKIIVGSIEACKPIEKLVHELTKNGFVVKRSNVSDYHFNEMYFLLEFHGVKFDHKKIKIEYIMWREPNIFFCKCHWSIVELELFE